MLNRCIVRETTVGSSKVLEHQPGLYLGQERPPHLLTQRPKAEDELFTQPKAVLAVCMHCRCVYLEEIVPPPRRLHTA